jgi:monoterpene epsilon-lactone hydrolase
MKPLTLLALAAASLAPLAPIALTAQSAPAAAAAAAPAPATPQATPQATPPPGPLTDTAVIDADGTAHITRVVPLPSILSPQQRTKLSKPGTDAASMDPDVFRRRAATQAWQDGAGKQAQKVYPVTITETKVAGIPVHLIDPLPSTIPGPVSGPGAGDADPLHYSAMPVNAASASAAKHPGTPETLHPDRVLMCVHGGGFDSDSGSYSEAIPIADLTRTRVVSVLYRLSPENAFPAALDDAIAVYKDLLKTYKPQNIAVYGTSAGAILTGEIAARIKQLGLPEPAALGVFSGFGDYTATGDSGALFTLFGFNGPLSAPKPGAPQALSTYVGSTSRRDPVLSPNLGDLHGLPPTLFLTSSRDLLLSGTADMERSWARDGVPTQMIVFDGLSHAFWLDVDMPESREAYATMARFFLQTMGH